MADVRPYSTLLLPAPGDAVSSVVVGVLFLVYRWQVTSRGASAADVNPAAG
jgi:hypothetical protein